MSRQWRRSPIGVAVFVLGVCVVAFCAWYDPFALSTRAKVSLQAAFDRVTQASYGPGAADRIGLITPTLDDVVSYKTGQPLSYLEMGKLVDFARLADAPAIYLDYTFSLRHPPEDSLTDLTGAIRDAERKGVKVLTGPVSPDPSFDALRALVEQTDVQNAVQHPADYPLMRPRPGAHPAAPWRSPAAALYRALCPARAAVQAKGCDAELAHRLEAEGPKAPLSLPHLALQLGAGFPTDERLYVGDDEANRCADPAAARRAALQAGLLGKTSDPPCIHFLTLPATAALGGPQKQQALRQMQGRVLLVGSGPHLGDDHDWPGLGSVPGVVFHAAALDNLLTWGNRYRYWPPNIGRSNSGWDDLLQLALMFGVPAAVWFLMQIWRPPKSAGHGARPTRDEARKTAFLALGLLFVVSVAPPGLAALLFHFTDVPPASAIILVAVTWPLITALCGDELGARLRPFNTPRAAGLLVGLAAASAVAVLGLFPHSGAWGGLLAAALLAALGRRPVLNAFRRRRRRLRRKAVTPALRPVEAPP